MLTDRTIIVTGASSGIGRATAEAFLDAGWTVGLLARKLLPVVGRALDARAETIRTQIDEAKANVTSARADLVLAEAELDRKARLVKSNVASRETYDTAKAAAMARHARTAARKGACLRA